MPVASKIVISSGEVRPLIFPLITSPSSPAMSFSETTPFAAASSSSPHLMHCGVSSVKMRAPAKISGSISSLPGMSAPTQLRCRPGFTHSFLITGEARGRHRYRYVAFGERRG